MWYIMKGVQESVLKHHKISLAILSLLYVFSAAICSLGFNHAIGHVETGNISDIHCGTGGSSHVPPKGEGPAFVDLTLHRKLWAHVVEPKLPILVYSIFKIPKPS